MKNTLAFLALVLLLFGGLGWYLDWYRIRPTASTNPGHTTVSIDINKDKIAEDVQKGLEQGEAKLHEALEKRQTTQKTTAPLNGTGAASRAAPQNPSRAYPAQEGFLLPREN